MVLTLRVSMMTAVGPASRPSVSRSVMTREWRMVSHTPASRKVRRLILGFGVLDLVSGNQGADQRTEESLASFARVMDELEEPEIDREFLLRNAAMRPQPGAKQ